MRKISVIFGVLVLLPLFFQIALAHRGGTDSQGGHEDSYTGEYHYHHGETAHNHYDMDGDGTNDCPLSFVLGIEQQSIHSKYGYLDYSDFQEGYLYGFDSGYFSGINEGYASGYSEAERVAHQNYSRKIDQERKDAASDAYTICAVYGIPAAFLVGGVIMDKRERKIRSLYEGKTKPQNRSSVTRPGKHSEKQNVEEVLHPTVPKSSLHDDSSPTTKPLHQTVKQESSRVIGPDPSSGIREMSFSDDAFFVTFGNGEKYIYYGVPASEGSEFWKAKNLMKFFLERIDGVYPYMIVPD